MMYDKDDREMEPVESPNMSEQSSGGYIAEYLTPLLYELSIANAPLPPEDCRDLADKIGARIGGVRHRVETALSRLETIDTTALAAKGLYDEARAVGEARVFIDQLIGLERDPPNLPANNSCDSTELLLITDELAKEIYSAHSSPSHLQNLLMDFAEEIKRRSIEP